MKLVNGYRIMLVGIAAAVVFGGGSAKADFAFGEPTNLGPTINSSSGEAVDCFSADGREMYFDSKRSGGYGGWDIWVAKRPTIDDDWGPPENLGQPINSGKNDVCANISYDGLALYFDDTSDIWVATRETVNDPWDPPVNLGPTINTSAWEGAPFISSDGLELYFSREGGGYGSWDIWVAKREALDKPWDDPVNLGEVVNSPASECYPFISADGLLLLFSDFGFGTPTRPGGFGNIDMWMARRSSLSDPWGTPMNLGPMVNGPNLDCGPKISPDGSTLFFCSERPGGFGGPYGDIYEAPIIPIVDLNNDGIVDATDMCIIVDHWGTDNSLCDIGPMPWGDGIVDVQDLIVLAEHLFEEYPPVESVE